MVIPKTALLWTGKTSFVYKITQNEHAVDVIILTPVTLGLQFDDYVKVISGIEVGDLIVKIGVFILDSAVQLAGLESMMQQDNETNEDNIETKKWLKQRSCFRSKQKKSC